MRALERRKFSAKDNLPPFEHPTIYKNGENPLDLVHV